MQDFEKKNPWGQDCVRHWERAHIALQGAAAGVMVVEVTGAVAALAGFGRALGIPHEKRTCRRRWCWSQTHQAKNLWFFKCKFVSCIVCIVFSLSSAVSSSLFPCFCFTVPFFSLYLLSVTPFLQASHAHLSVSWVWKAERWTLTDLGERERNSAFAPHINRALSSADTGTITNTKHKALLSRPLSLNDGGVIPGIG